MCVCVTRTYVRTLLIGSLFQFSPDFSIGPIFYSNISYRKIWDGKDGTGCQSLLQKGDS